MDVEIQVGENKNELLHDLDTWFRHSETIGQTRLGNFLTIESFLLAACAFLFEKEPVEKPTTLIVVITLLGGMSSAFFYFLGSRQKKFHQYIERVSDDVVKKMSYEEQENSAFAIVREFQHGNHRKEDNPSKYEPNLNWFEHSCTSRQALVIGPILYFLCFLFLFVFVISQRFH